MSQRDHGHTGGSNPCKPISDTDPPNALPPVLKQKIVKKGPCNSLKNP